MIDIPDNVPDAIPLQYLGAVEIDLSKVSTEEFLLHNLAKGGQGGVQEGGYAVRHGRNPVSEFPNDRNANNPTQQSGDSPKHPPNYSIYAYPYLYPYGMGGIEAEREVLVSMAEHVRHSLLLHDKRFSTHYSWMFTFFSILQKRQALLAARVQISRKDFNHTAELFSTITRKELSIAAEEEAGKCPITNPKIKTLRKHMHTSGAKVMGSDSSRLAYRSQIWSTSESLNPPSLWITINPTDLHDPIVQVLMGEQIDMDDFQAINGPNADKHGRYLALNPAAAAQYFNLFIALVLEELFICNFHKAPGDLRSHGSHGITSSIWQEVSGDLPYVLQRVTKPP
jgi:hypothetical protein